MVPGPKCPETFRTWAGLKKTGFFLKKARPSGFYWALGFCVSSSTITELYTTEVVDSGIKVLKGIRKEQKVNYEVTKVSMAAVWQLFITARQHS